MKNSILKIVTLIICIYSRSLDCEAQVIDNKVNIYAEYIIGIFHGKELIEEKNFIYPSLYNNLKDIDGISLKWLYKNHQHISLGINVILLQASNWEYTGHSEYHGSKIKMQSISPTIQFHSKFSETNIFNRGRVFIEIGPTVGLSKLTLSNPLFDIQNEKDAVSIPMKSNDIFYGLTGNVGLEWAITQLIGIYITYSLQFNWVTSKLYNDNQFTSSQLGIGIIMKFKKDKRYFY